MFSEEQVQTVLRVLAEDATNSRLVVHLIPANERNSIGQAILNRMRHLDTEEKKFIYAFTGYSLPDPSVTNQEVQSVLNEFETLVRENKNSKEMESLEGGVTGHELETFRHFLAALRQLWHLIIKGAMVEFEQKTVDGVDGSFLFPKLCQTLMQFTLVDHDLSDKNASEHAGAQTITSVQLRRFSKSQNFKQKKRLLTVLHARRPLCCDAAAMMNDFDRVVLPGVKLF